MKKIGLKEFYNFHFLSNLNISPCKSNLFFVETMVDEENNDYKQRLLRLNVKTNECDEMIPFQKRVGMWLIGCGNLLVVDADKEDKTINTQFKQLHPKTGETIKTFKLPLDVSAIKEFNENTYLVLATIDTNAADYYKWNDEQKKAYHDVKEENADYLEFDEYPFVFNGAGVINGNRNALFLVDKESLECTRITSSTMDVESFDYEGNKVVYTGVNFESFKGPQANVYEYDVETKETSTLLDCMYARKVFFYKGVVTVCGTYGENYGAMQTSNFYELRDGEPVLVMKNEMSLFNSVGTDVHYGRGKNFLRLGDDVYFVSTLGYKALLFKYEDYELKPIVDLNGSVDDFVIGEDGIYCIGLKDQALQEVYKVADEITQLTKFNDMSEFYVAKPKHIVLDKLTPIDGWVLLPEDFDENKKYPSILDIHGGPKAAYGEVFYHEMQYWVNLGYIVFYLNPRGGDGKGNAFADLRRQWGGIDYQDIMDYTDMILRLYPQIDTNRMGVTGGSYGGFMTNWIIGQTNRFAAAATQRSISNWISEVGCSDYGIDFPVEQEYTDMYNCHDELWAMSPLKFANNATTPTLFIHSTEDFRCTFDQALQLYTVLKCRGVESKLVGFKGENHELSRGGKPKHRVKRLFEITEWMNKHLL